MVVGRDRHGQVWLWARTGMDGHGLWTGKGMNRHELWTRTGSDKAIVPEKAVEAIWCTVPEEIQTPESLKSTTDL